MRRICIMGGTFDPIHFGHLVVAEEVRCRFALEKVVFIPTGKPPHKKNQRITDPLDRLKMVQLATADNEFFEVSRLEIDRQGYSYTIDTVRAVKALYNAEKVYFITGADAALEIFTWKDVEELLTICTFIAATRPGFNLNSLEESLKSLPNNISKNIIPLEVPALSISSTDIRQRVKEGRSIKYLLPASVENYIWQNNLYTK
ncbi:nicotinate-nucleotide adenylyltransferase [Desulfotomaculum nigrificans CO-1-SRB]|uniref:Probable nicotinate-nucleotide adenylyltransferase n=1 Tax=Desulfotomaculum nigrificans (strain DSM 14880 / VKM B-2319 / CO-1-SRB) TaxID=868595 RepID=F6B8Q4_DESCC|nr:nicotinate-nucleotide adenylyltransferase [Desulfotomaculum nigrificans]AEF94747.1 nicotinate-nucleotide adenylyltransferase [Desulfotomaculum nigrificans CO-1-SRB]